MHALKCVVFLISGIDVVLMFAHTHAHSFMPLHSPFSPRKNSADYWAKFGRRKLRRLGNCAKCCIYFIFNIKNHMSLYVQFGHETHVVDYLYINYRITL